MKHVILALGLFAISAPAWAHFPDNSEMLPAVAHPVRNADCEEISPPAIFFKDKRVVLQPESSMRPPENLRKPVAQGEADDCFAYASSEAITQRTGVIVSPLDIATTYFFTPVDDAVRVIEAKGFSKGDAAVAIEKKIRADRKEWDIMPPKGKPKIGYIDYIAGGDEASAELMANAKGLCPSSDLESEQGFKYQEKILRHIRANHSKGLTLPPDATDVDDKRAVAVNAAWVRYVDQVCHRVPSPVPLIPLQVWFANDVDEWKAKPADEKAKAHDTLFSWIDYALDHGRTPIAGIDWYIFEDPDGTPGDHAISVVGRKRMNGVCHYLLRDNVDEPCKNLHDKFKPRCLNGHIWVTESELAETLYSVSYLR